jgi:arsenite-transporting ATPase
MTAPSFLYNEDLQLVLFGGKGGVGKTTCAAAAALFMARRSPRKSFLLVSTDPAHSLADSLAGSKPPSNLKIVEFNARECMETFKEMHRRELSRIAMVGTFLDEEDINKLLLLSLPGLDELMAFIEITMWVDERNYDCIVVDTAPTGHTIRLLMMPELIRKWIGMLDALLAKHRYMKRVFKGSYSRDELDRFIEEMISSVEKMEILLRSRDRCRFVPVMLAETLSIRETVTLINELGSLKIPVLDIVVNRIYPESACRVCGCIRRRQMQELDNFMLYNDTFRHALWSIPIYPREVRGAGPLASFWEDISMFPGSVGCFPEVEPDPPPKVEAAPERPGGAIALLLFAGKGGVGKTTLACATAVRLAHDFRGKEIFLFSTDPANSLSACLDIHVGPEPVNVTAGLTAMEIDARREFENLKAEYAEELKGLLEYALPNIDLTFDREVLERLMDLAPPGLDEIMALTKAMDFLSKGNHDLFIFDTAPTGHLIRLMELPGIIDQWLKFFFGLFLKYENVFRLPGISQRLVRMSKDLKYLRSLLSDSTGSALYAVSIQTEMALQETKDLTAACEGMGVHVPVVFLNLATEAGDCPLCSSLSSREARVRGKFRRAFRDRHLALVYRRSEPRGLKRLFDLGQVLYQPVPRGLTPGLYGKNTIGKNDCRDMGRREGI